MTQETKNSILIIGGGLLGLSIAYKFSRNNFKVLVLSKNRNESAGFVAAGMLATHAEGLEDELLRFGQESQGDHQAPDRGRQGYAGPTRGPC